MIFIQCNSHTSKQYLQNPTIGRNLEKSHEWKKKIMRNLVKKPGRTGGIIT